VYTASIHTKFQAEIEAVKEVTGDTLCDTVDNFVVGLQGVKEVNGYRTEHVFTWTLHANEISIKVCFYSFTNR